MLFLVTVRFSQSLYTVNENDGSVQPVLVLSNPASTDITVVVEDISYNASGKLYVKYYKHTLDQREMHILNTKMALCNHLCSTAHIVVYYVQLKNLAHINPLRTVRFLKIRFATIKIIIQF